MVFSVFTVTDSGLNCSDVGLVDLATSEECKAAVTDATSFNSNANYKREFSGKDFRKGCYIWDREDGDMWFNKQKQEVLNTLRPLEVFARMVILSDI